MIDLIASASIGGLTIGALVYLAMKDRIAGRYNDGFTDGVRYNQFGGGE